MRQLTEDELKQVREALETGLEASRNDDDSIEISAAIALLDAEQASDKVECPECDGEGEVYGPPRWHMDNSAVTCPACNGTGKATDTRRA